ncbi:hypothetical protein [Labilibaculum antarcticum]|uniref:Uncharacterized protein n=1 Tax=Labilibaculum antarcticum TaxID=1717717 RepID=A0A1Y1CL44_9BACT|nr:hypothetical protein [Labilibaculum antarcticum]BAX81129.1 hypothetical protein ALGA_2822 [Labilibaculum antarcticum]
MNGRRNIINAFKLFAFSMAIVLVFLCDFVNAQSPFLDQSIFEDGTSVKVDFETDDFQEIKDSVYLFFDRDRMPVFYFQKLFTPVCDDTVCKPVTITLIWNLLGNYKNYRVDANKLLSKRDHTNFSDEDYEKLHQVLSNEYSVLKSFSKENLSSLHQKKKEGAYDEVDAVSGATPKKIKNDVVEGALYTCYTLWFYSHGLIKEQLLNYTDSKLFNEQLLHEMLLSNKMKEFDFALNKLVDFSVDVYQDDLIQILSVGNSFITDRISKALPVKLIRDNGFVEDLWNLYGNLHYQSQVLVLEQLKKNHQLDSKLLNKMISYSFEANESQYVLFLKIFLNQQLISENQVKLIVKSAKARRGKLSGESIRSLDVNAGDEKMISIQNKILQLLKI